MRLVLYTGKGGVGKTTTAAATAVIAAQRGRRTLVASADAAHSLGDVLEQRLGADPLALAPGLDAIEIDARVETQRHWGRIRDFLVELLAHQGIDAVVAEELALLPGAEEIVTLLAVEELAAAGRYDLVVVDCAPTDSTLRLVTLPDVAHRALRVLLPALPRRFRGGDAARAPPRRAAAARIRGLPRRRGAALRAAARLQQRITHATTSVRLVVTPERMVIDEARRAWTELALFEVPCDAVVMNRLLPEGAAGEAFFREWGRLQEERRREVEELFAPLPVAHGAARARRGDRSRAARGARRADLPRRRAGRSAPRAPRVRFGRDGRGLHGELPLPGADPARLDVAKLDDELTITTGLRRRLICCRGASRRSR